MKQFIYRLFYFVSIPLALALLCDIWLSNTLKKSKEFPCENEVWNDIYDSNIDADILVLGSSRAWVHIDPKVIKDSLGKTCYNLGEDGSNIFLQYLRLKEFCAYNPLPETVVWSVDMFSFKNSDNGYPTFRYYPYMLFNLDLYHSITEEGKIGTNATKFFVPFLRYFNSMSIMSVFSKRNNRYVEKFGKKFQLNSEGNFRENGYRGLDLVWDESFGHAKDVDRYSIEVDYDLFILTEFILDELLRNNVEVFLVYTPEYIDGQSVIENSDTIMSLFNQLADEKGICFLNYRSDDICYERDLFYNNQHLNLNGATLFTRDLVSDLANIVE